MLGEAFAPTGGMPLSKTGGCGPLSRTRRGLHGGCVIALLLMASMGAPPAASDECQVLSSTYMDADRNRIFDLLDDEMANQSENWTTSVIVLLAVDPTPAEIQNIKDALGGFVITSNKNQPSDAEGKPWTVIPGLSATLTKSQISTLAQRCDVRQVEQNGKVTVLMDTAKVESGVNGARTDFNVDGDRTGNSRSYSKDDIVICVLDTGIHDEHVDLNEGQVIAWKDFVGGLTEPYDDNGHGTHVAGIAAGQGDGNSGYRGVADGAAVVVGKVLDGDGGGTFQDVIDGINWCKDNKALYGIEIINLSLGSTDPCDDGTDSLAQAANDATPGTAANIITVGMMGDPKNAACDSYLGNGWYLQKLSSRGPTRDGRIKPDLVAPGVCITAPKAIATNETSQDYTTKTGTSMASPFVAGVAALMLDANTSLAPSDIKTKLHQTTQDWGVNNEPSEPESYDYGAGRLQAHDAVESACNCGDFAGPANPAHFHTVEDLADTGKIDDYELEVTNAAWSVSITLLIPGSSLTRDFDLYLFAPDGTQIASSLGVVTRQETISKDISGTGTGTYKVRVKSFIGSGNYWLDVSAGATSLTLVRDE